MSTESRARPLVVVETHPVQYHAPVYRAVEEKHGIPVETIYGSDFSVAGYFDQEFQTQFAWDVDLVASRSNTFLSKTSQGGAGSYGEVSARGLGAALARSGAGAVLLTGYQPGFCLAAFYQAWRNGYPILFRAETTDHANARDVLKARMRDWGLRRLYSRCKRVLPIGTRSRDHYRRLGVAAGKIVFSPYCVDVTPFRCDEPARAEMRTEKRDELGIAEDDLAILFSGKLSKRKGVHGLIGALKSMPAGYRKRVVVLFVGDGEEKQALMDRCNCEPSVRAEFAGFVNQTRLSPYFHAADLLALPSIEAETWGLVVNEALHHGLPCVVTDAVGCAPDLVESGVTGEIAATGSSESLAEAIRRAAAIVKSEDVRRVCRDKVSAFTVDAAAQGIAEAYRSVVRQL
jgi:glycosyltransferase involved in cell wall biosynthesis